MTILNQKNVGQFLYLSVIESFSVKSTPVCKVSPLVWSIFIGQNADLTSGLDCTGLDHCPRILLSCFRERNSGQKGQVAVIKSAGSEGGYRLECILFMWRRLWWRSHHRFPLSIELSPLGDRTGYKSQREPLKHRGFPLLGTLVANFPHIHLFWVTGIQGDNCGRQQAFVD